MQERIRVDSGHQGLRVDTFLALQWAGKFSRSQIKKHIASGLIRVQGRAISPHYKVKAGDEIEFEWHQKRDTETRAEDIPLSILYEDEALILIDKPAGMVVHPAHGNPDHTLVNALLFHWQGLSDAGGTLRPGIVHRLDKDTSGIMVIAKNDQVHGHLSKQFKTHQVEKTYFVFVRGVMQHDEGICEEPVGRAFLNRKKVVVKPSGGKAAATFFRVRKRFSRATWLEVMPKTGRTHQIRVHMQHLHYPVLGDPLYGVPCPAIGRQALHAFSLRFTHPLTRGRIYFEAPLPQDLKELLAYLETEP